jgi:sodium/potassium-transporting ATPase subunit alpha
MEFAAGMFSYFSIFATNGWLPLRMVGIEQKWDSAAINDLEDDYGQEWSYTARQELKITAQTASFIAIVLMQVANVICCKTRRMSILQKGLE